MLRGTIGVVMLAMLATVCVAGEGEAATTWLDALIERDTLSDGFFGAGRVLDDKGISVGLSLTEVYQVNTRGGLDTDNGKDRWSGSYDVEAEIDLERLLGLRGLTAFVGAEGSWSNGTGPISVGSMSGINGDAGGSRSFDVGEVWFEQALFQEMVRIRVGKLDISGGFESRGCPVAFDCNSFANDETGQFLNGFLTNNPTIPFPDNGLGAVVYVQPTEWLYFAAGASDAQADARETGFSTTFHDEDYFFSACESGVTPELDGPNGAMVGAYRIGMWYDPQDKARNSGSTKRDDTGFYLSADQVVTKENAGVDDTQGLGVFGRLGYADESVSMVRCFWSIGAQYQGLLPNRDDDVVAFGVAQGRGTKAAGLTASSETAMEVYYNAPVTGWLSVSPSVQYIVNPGGLKAVKDAVVFGLRFQVAF